jgi:uncharacterized membrane protein
MQFADLVDAVGTWLDLFGVGMIALGAFVVFLLASIRLMRRPHDPEAAYSDLRKGLGRVILLGLELLVGADIIRTVAVAPSFRSVGVLAGIVVIRTFLSFTLELEIDGRWPWQRPDNAKTM